MLRALPGDPAQLKRAGAGTAAVPQGEVEIDLDQARGPLREWIAQEPVQREIRRRFARLLKTFADDNGDAVYRQRVRDMVRSEWHSRRLRSAVGGSCAACITAGWAA